MKTNELVHCKAPRRHREEQSFNHRQTETVYYHCSDKRHYTYSSMGVKQRNNFVLSTKETLLGIKALFLSRRGINS